MRFDSENYLTPFVVDFTCLDCGHDFWRLVRREPESVRRCSPCEAAHIRQVSDRLLAQVNATWPPPNA